MTHLDPDGAVRLTPQVPVSAATLQAWYDAGQEGAVVKRLSAIYQPGVRSRDWVKFKKLCAASVVITGYVAAKLGPYAKVTGVDARGVVVTVKTLNAEWRRKFAAAPTAWRGRTLVIAYQQLTAEGKYWHPRWDHIL